MSVHQLHGSPVTAEELLALAEFLAPSAHFVSDGHMRDAAVGLADWADEQPQIVSQALKLATARHCRRTVIDVLRAAGSRPRAETNVVHLRAS